MDKKDTNRKMLEALESVVDKLTGKQRESAEFQIRSLRSKIESNKNDMLTGTCSLLSHKAIEQKINKEKNLINGYDKLMKVDKDLSVKLSAKKALTEKKIYFLKKELKKASDDKPDMDKNAQTSGTIKIDIVELICDPLFECERIDIYVDTYLKESLNSRFKGMVNITLENNYEFEILLVGKDDVLLGLIFLPCVYFISHKEFDEINFDFGNDAILKSKIMFQREIKLIRKNAAIVCVYKIGHSLEDYHTISPHYCCVCDNMANIFSKMYRCYKCKFVCHKECANYILFKCPCTRVADEKESAVNRYNIPHVLSKESASGMRYCGHCGMRIASGSLCYNCTKCNRKYHEECSKLLFNSCGIEYELRVKMADFKPPPLEIKTEEAKFKIDDFSLIKVLGRGSFGKVMLASNKAKKDIIALKILKKESVINSNDIVYLESERRILKMVSEPSHPFLMRLLYCFQDSRNIYFGTEFLAGGDLFHYATKKAFLPEQIKLYACEILLGLEYLHKKCVIYRDMKLDNVLIGADGHVKIADFGLCKDEVGPYTITHTLCGTPDTIAPEVIISGGYTKDADWWSYGVVLFEMFEAEPPFNGATDDEMSAAIINSDVIFRGETPDIAKNLILALLVKDPKKRLGCGEEDGDAIKKHPYFSDINWDDVYNKKITPVYIPDDSVAANFDEEFTGEPIIITPSSSVRKYDKFFANFK
ncbi:Protein kinase C-like 1B [Astathelohania contejeani]|uniref:protein kinase C n=1 Tax=Astathelohania contejeani TaxID=164912 RepID=A0ABQ7I1P7_9MICR|nr:Protein kinase C-like 1B [Thelohania contejeani]